MKATILRSASNTVMQFDWGQLTWFANAELGNSPDVTLGECILFPLKANPLHSHPNCDEILTVRKGRISHVVEGGKEVTMEEGDSVTLPAGLPHRARNLLDEPAVLAIAFNTGTRQTQGED